MNQEKAGHKVFFVDTYALYELALGNENFKEYFSGVKCITTIFNLYELYYTILREDLPLVAENFFERFLPVCIILEPQLIKEAAMFRLRNKKLKLSYADALGYIAAKNHFAIFLTGDEAFRKLPNVEFVK